MNLSTSLLIKHIKLADSNYQENEILNCLKEENSEEGKLLNACLNAIKEAIELKIKESLKIKK